MPSLFHLTLMPHANLGSFSRKIYEDFRLANKVATPVSNFIMDGNLTNIANNLIRVISSSSC